MRYSGGFDWSLELRLFPLLRARWKQVLFGALFQYVHGMATQLAHRMHQPQEVPLGDIGFKYLPELGLENAWMSESIFWCLFIPFILWSFSPFVTARKRFYTAVIYARILMVLTTCQLLRIISFTVTQLPAPNYHCRAGEETAIREMPTSWWGHIYVDVGRQATHGCGDLIFSSHTTFVLVGVLTFTEYGETLLIKLIAWIGVAAMGLCIIASRKHYSVDVVVAWYTVPLVFYAMHRRWTTKRPVQDYWPHRPLAGEGEGTDAGAAAHEAAAALDGEAKPLLPVVTSLPLHSRTSSRSTTDLRLLGKPPLPPKEPASPPPGSGIGFASGLDGSLNGGGVVATVAGALRGARPQRRQSSISGSINGSTIPLEVEMRDLEAGGGGALSNGIGGGGGGGGGSSSQDSPPLQRSRRDSSPGPVNPATPECSMM
ncbi:putativeceramide inositolphosphotransferase [Nannochloris sp. 'desiccata']|nr:putativeceramide inositolphosphotransferase [Chlorella desiccata (nom. nud.)]KAH7622680.1 putativeceramide inositolphosphotransferase [Chlorella desiccata (nom. nud.)]